MGCEYKDDCIEFGVWFASGEVMFRLWQAGLIPAAALSSLLLIIYFHQLPIVHPVQRGKSALPSDSPRTEIILYFTKRVDKLINDCVENVDG